MVRVIDRTLSMPFPDGTPSGGQLLSFCNFLAAAGVQGIETSLPVWNTLRELPWLPDKIRWIVRIDRPEQMTEAGLSYVCQGRDLPLLPNLQVEQSIRDMREIPYLSLPSPCASIRLSGLPDLIRQDYRSVFDKWLQQFGSSLCFCPGDSLGCATAMAIEWVLAGGKQVATAFAGQGELAATEVVLMGLRVIDRRMPNADLSFMPEMAALYESMFQVHVSEKAPVIGRRIFEVEAGIHADGLAKGAITYEPYPPAVVGLAHKLVVGKHSGIRSIRLKLQECAISLPEGLLEDLLRSVQNCSMLKRRSLEGEEFRRLAEEAVRCES